MKNFSAFLSKDQPPKFKVWCLVDLLLLNFNTRKSINENVVLLSLNVNGLNAPIKRYRVTEWIRKQDSYVYAVHKRPTEDQRHTQTANKGMKKDISCKWK